MLDTLDVWDGHLAAHGADLIAARIELVNQLAPEVEKAYQLLAPASRPAAIRYRSGVELVEQEAAAGPAARNSSKRHFWRHWLSDAWPSSNVGSAWWVRTETTSS